MVSKKERRNIELTMIFLGLYIAFALYNDDPSGFGPLLVGGIAYLSCLLLSIAGFALINKRERLMYIVLLSAATTIVMIFSYLATNGNGSPVPGNRVSTICSNIEVPNSTSPSGFVYGSKCTGSPFFEGVSVLYDLAFWAPVVGSVIFSMPCWLGSPRQNLVSTLSRILKGAVPAATLLFLTYGLINASGGFPELFNGLSPLNPFIAYNYCDSSTFGLASCVQTNGPIYFLDYLFWISIICLVSMIASELHSTKLRSERKQHSDPPVIISLEVSD